MPQAPTPSLSRRISTDWVILNQVAGTGWILLHRQFAGEITSCDFSRIFPIVVKLRFLHLTLLDAPDVLRSELLCIPFSTKAPAVPAGPQGYRQLSAQGHLREQSTDDEVPLYNLRGLHDKSDSPRRAGESKFPPAEG